MLSRSNTISFGNVRNDDIEDKETSAAVALAVVLSPRSSVALDVLPLRPAGLFFFMLLAVDKKDRDDQECTAVGARMRDKRNEKGRKRANDGDDWDDVHRNDDETASLVGLRWRSFFVIERYYPQPQQQAVSFSLLVTLYSV